MTTKESTDPGKPCIFPFVYKATNEKNINNSFWNCSFADTNGQPWCFTKVQADKTSAQETPEMLGICSEQCKGDPFEPSSKHNLARDDFMDIWASDIYDLRTFDDGFCHTYNPIRKQSTGFDFRLGLFLGHQSKNSFSEQNFESFDLYIHEKDQFWPRNNMEKQEQLSIRPNKSVQILFKFISETKLEDDENACVDK